MSTKQNENSSPHVIISATPFRGEWLTAYRLARLVCSIKAEHVECQFFKTHNFCLITARGADIIKVQKGAPVNG